MDPKEARPPEGTGVPSMMQMMEKMCGTGGCGTATMCQGMMSPAGKTAEADTDASATPELRKLFGDWARRFEDEALAALKTGGPLDLANLASALEISPESALSVLGKLVREGKATIGSIRAAGEGDASG